MQLLLIGTSRGPHMLAVPADAPLSLPHSGGAGIIQESGGRFFITFNTCLLKKRISTQRKLNECAAQKTSVGESSSSDLGMQPGKKIIAPAPLGMATMTWLEKLLGVGACPDRPLWKGPCHPFSPRTTSTQCFKTFNYSSLRGKEVGWSFKWGLG